MTQRFRHAEKTSRTARCHPAGGYVVAMARTLGKALLIALSAIVVSGCTTTTDVSNDPQYTGGYEPGVTYSLMSNATVYRLNSDPEPCRLAPPDTAYYNKPENAIAVAVLLSGSRVRVDRILHTTVTAAFNGESYTEVFVTPLDQSCGCSPLLLDNALSHWKRVNTPDGWPTMIASPDPAHLAPWPK